MSTTIKFDNGVTVTTTNLFGKTYKQKFEDMHLSFNPMPKGKYGFLGKRARATWYKTRLAFAQQQIDDIEKILGHSIHLGWHNYRLSLDDLKRFVVLMRQLPTLEHIKQFGYYDQADMFKFWFDRYYIEPKTRQESVFFTGSYAHKLYKKL